MCKVIEAAKSNPQTIVAKPTNSGNGFYVGNEYTFTKDTKLGLTYSTINSNGHERVESGDTLLEGKGSAHLNRCTFLGCGYGWEIISKSI